MGGAIANVRDERGLDHGSGARGAADAQFGVGGVQGFVGGAFAYRLYQAITARSRPPRPGSTCGRLGRRRHARGEALRAFRVAPNATGFRAGSSRIVVWFGDAPGSRPERRATDSSATAALQAAGSSVIAIRRRGGANGLEPTGQATRITAATGGVFLPGATTTSRRRDPRWAHEPSGDGDAQRQLSGGRERSLTPASQTVTSGGTVTFSETYGVNAGTLAGTYVCNGRLPA